MVVPNHSPLVVIAGGSSAEFYYRVHANYQHTRYRYSVLLTSGKTGTGATIDIPPGSTIPPSGRVYTRRGAIPLYFDIDVSARAESEVDLALKIGAVTNDVVVEGISVEALPRAFLDEDSNDLGSERFEFSLRRIISERNFANNLLDYQSVLKRSARRAMFQYAWGDLTPQATTSDVLVDVFDGTFGLIGRYLYSGETTRELSWRVRAYCSDATTAGELVLTNTGTGAASSTIPIPINSVAGNWFPATSAAPATFDVDCEDTTHSLGLRGGAVDEHTIQFRRTAGSGTVYLQSISIWEAPSAAPPAPGFQRITEDGDVRITEDGDVRITE